MKHAWMPLGMALIAFSAALASPDGRSAAGDTPVKIAVTGPLGAIASGTEVSVTVRLSPNPGFKLNKYPKIKLQVPAVAGLVAAVENSIGNPTPPPADQLDSNYFHHDVDPLEVTLHMDPKAAKGHHDLHAKLSYFYCVAASGYCAPAKTDVIIPLMIR